MNESIKDRVFDLLDKSRGKWPSIAEESGIGYWWILKFMARKIPNPGVDKLESLENYFAGKIDRDRTTADAPMDAGMKNVATPAAAEPSTVDGEAA